VQRLITIIFWQTQHSQTMRHRKVASLFPPHLSTATALPLEMAKLEMANFVSNCRFYFC